MANAKKKAQKEPQEPKIYPVELVASHVIPKEDMPNRQRRNSFHPVGAVDFEGEEGKPEKVEVYFDSPLGWVMFRMPDETGFRIDLAITANQVYRHWKNRLNPQPKRPLLDITTEEVERVFRAAVGRQTPFENFAREHYQLVQRAGGGRTILSIRYGDLLVELTDTGLLKGAQFMGDQMFPVELNPWTSYKLLEQAGYDIAYKAPAAEPTLE